jgi:hypothetical protein
MGAGSNPFERAGTSVVCLSEFLLKLKVLRQREFSRQTVSVTVPMMIRAVAWGASPL